MATVSPPLLVAPTPRMINSQPGARETSVRAGVLASRWTLLKIQAALRGVNMGIGAAARCFGVCGGVEVTNGAESGSTGMIGGFKF